MTLSAGELGERLVDALEAADLRVDMETELHERPLLLTVARGVERYRLRTFLWNATPGGPPGVRAETEFRVQTTRPGSVPFLVAEDRQTLLLGYHEDLGVFAAWDVRVHPNPGSSSSLQVALETLEEAEGVGFTSRPRQLASGDDEVVVAFSPDNVGTYLEILPAFQTAVVDSSDAPLGAAITSGDEPAETDLPVDAERRRAVRKVAVLVRDSRFRRRVIKAYGGRCAFCGVGLGITDAAHIQAVRDEGPDLVSNGVCACPTHHRAFDRGLVLVDTDLGIELNRPLLEELGHPADQVAEFEDGMLKELVVPETDAPGPTFIEHHRARWSDEG